MIEIDLNHVRALGLRAQELVVETSDAGEEQHKLLAFALLLCHIKNHKEAARAFARDSGLPSSIIEAIDDPDLLPRLCDMNTKSAKNDLDFAGKIWPLIEAVVLKGERR